MALHTGDTAHFWVDGADASAGGVPSAGGSGPGRLGRVILACGWRAQGRDRYALGETVTRARRFVTRKDGTYPDDDDDAAWRRLRSFSRRVIILPLAAEHRLVAHGRASNEVATADIAEVLVVGAALAPDVHTAIQTQLAYKYNLASAASAAPVPPPLAPAPPPLPPAAAESAAAVAAAEGKDAKARGGAARAAAVAAERAAAAAAVRAVPASSRFGVSIAALWFRMKGGRSGDDNGAETDPALELKADSMLVLNPDEASRSYSSVFAGQAPGASSPGAARRRGVSRAEFRRARVLMRARFSPAHPHPPRLAPIVPSRRYGARALDARLPAGVVGAGE